MKNSTKDLGVFPASRPVLSTLHHVRVVESYHLAALRRRAYADVGGTGKYEGSYSDHLSLEKSLLKTVDARLAELVSENEELLHSDRHNHIVIYEGPQAANLALDQGVNKIFDNGSGGRMTYAAFNNVACAGTGTTPTFVDSGSITATASGTTATSSAGFFTSGMNGYLIKFDSGEERYITFVDTTHVTLSSSLTIASGTLFTVYAVNQTGLVNEVKRTHTFLTGSGNTGSSDASPIRTYKVTHDFSAEVSNTNYTEVGWSEDTSVGNNLNARSLIAGGTVTVLIGQQLRTIHSLILTVGPLVSTSGTYSITGWPVSPSTDTNGNYLIAQPFASGVLSDLNGSGGPGSGQIDGGAAGALGTGTALPSPGNAYSPGTSAAPDSTASLSYTANSFFRDTESTFNLSSANRTDWRGIYTQGNFGNQGFVFVFGQNQTKDNSHVLKFRIRYSCTRVLTNP